MTRGIAHGRRPGARLLPRLGAAVLAAVLVVGIAAGCSEDRGGDGTPASGATTTSAPRGDETQGQARVERARAEGLRVLLAGDDVMAAAGPVVARRLEATGRATAEVDVEPGTGLASSLDWPARIAARVDEIQPTVVVVHFGGIDTAPYATGPDGRPLEPGSGPWYDRWAQQQATLVEALAGRGIALYWVAAPPARDPALDTRVQMANLLSEGLHRGWPDWVAHVDARRGLVGPDGGFAETVAVPGGETLVLRDTDGYGLGPDGAARLATAVTDRLVAHWCLDGAPGCRPAFTSVLPLPSDTPAGPRVLLVGDSMMWQLVPAVAAVLESGGIHVHDDIRSTTGLVGDFDWVGRVGALAEAWDPDVVVGLFTGDLRPGYADPTGQVVEMDSPRYFELTTGAATTLTEQLVARGTRVLWVAGPPAAGGPVAERMARFRELYESLAARFGEQVGVVDGMSPLLDRGEFALELPDELGVAVAVRLPDAFHLTTAGAGRLAGAVVEAVRATGATG